MKIERNNGWRWKINKKNEKKNQCGYEIVWKRLKRNSWKVKLLSEHG